ncbi:hypothetical protein [Streptomyces violaceusniger]|uniref:Uncharacterized protein n=1 Tax=Streptomyces violaceusniger TaxID=68280 RepID=A0A4D4LRU5_STRVO|nr:hypothetical protein SVIO_111720 [Streptomyces violaceusniger]
MNVTTNALTDSCTRLAASLALFSIDHYIEQRHDGYALLALSHSQRLTLQALTAEEDLLPIDRQDRGVDTTRFVLTATETERLATHLESTHAQS